MRWVGVCVRLSAQDQLVTLKYNANPEQEPGGAEDSVDRLDRAKGQEGAPNRTGHL